MQAPSPDPKPLDHLVLGGDRDAIAVDARFGTLTYGDLDDWVGRYASGLLAKGLKPGDRIAVGGEASGAVTLKATVDPSGALLVADDVGNAVWRVSK